MLYHFSDIFFAFFNKKSYNILYVKESFLCTFFLSELNSLGSQNSLWKSTPINCISFFSPFPYSMWFNPSNKIVIHDFNDIIENNERQNWKEWKFIVIVHFNSDKNRASPAFVWIQIIYGTQFVYCYNSQISALLDVSICCLLQFVQILVTVLPIGRIMYRNKLCLRIWLKEKRSSSMRKYSYKNVAHTLEKKTLV